MSTDRRGVLRRRHRIGALQRGEGELRHAELVREDGFPGVEEPRRRIGALASDGGEHAKAHRRSRVAHVKGSGGLVGIATALVVFGIDGT